MSRLGSWFDKLTTSGGPRPRARTRPRSAAARPRKGVAAAPREQHLEELHRAGRERRLRAGKIEPPGADERLAEHPCDIIGRRLEAPAPVLQRGRVVPPEI